MKLIGFVSIFFLTCLSLAQTDIFTDVTVKRLSTFEVATGAHIGFPSMILLPNDTILMVYRKGISHAEISGRIMRVYGTKNGSWWSAPQTLVDAPAIDERDPSLTLLSDGRIMLSYYTYLPGNTMTIPQTPPITSIHVCFSSDNGLTFTAPHSIDGNQFSALPIGTTFSGTHFNLPNGEIFQTYGTSSPAVEIHDKIVIPAYGGNALVMSSTPGYTVSEPNELFFFVSSNGGITWQKQLVAENFLPNSWKAEPYLVELNNGNFLMHYRCADEIDNPMSPGPMRQAILNPSLSVFTPDMDFNFVGHAPDILKMDNGILVSAFRKVNSGPLSLDVCFVFSKDHGYSWSDTIRVQNGTTENAYPTMIQISPNKFLIAYYLSGGVKIRVTAYEFVIKEEAVINPMTAITEEAIYASTPESSDKFEMNVFPNPTTDFLTIHFLNNEPLNSNVEIYAANGNLVYAQNHLIIPDELLKINLSEYPKGNYYIRVISGDKIFFEKIIIQ